MRTVKTILTFVGGVAAGILAAAGIQALDDDSVKNNLADGYETDKDQEIEDATIE